MKIPEFTAEASLYETSSRYRSPGQRGGTQRPDIIPQRGGVGFKGHPGCEMDCLDQHPGLTHDQCRRMCNDPFGGTDLSTPGNWLNHLLSSAGIDFWEGACRVNPVSGSVPYLCGSLANEMRRQS